MTDDNKDNLVDIANTDNQEEFEKAFFNTEDTEENNSNEDVDDEDDSLATDEDQDAPDDEGDDDDEELEDDEPEDEPEEEAPKAKRNRKSAKDRIEELYASDKQKERDLVALRAEFEKYKASAREPAKEDDKPDIRDSLPADAPKPDAEGKDGKPLYPLGEFDPRFIQDLTRFTIEQEMKVAEKQREEERQQNEYKAVQETLQASWLENLDKAEEELPDIRENIRGLTETFQDLPPAYGEYLASTLMASEFGPQIMHYLSQNIGEAQKIVASGPAAATRAIGRLEAKFEPSSKPETQQQLRKVSEASAPPEMKTRGHGGRFTPSPDTDDQDAFEREFFKKP